MGKNMNDGWLENPSSKNILRFYKSQSNQNKMFIIFIDKIVKENEEVDFIIKEKESLKVNEAVHLWRDLKTKGWKEIKSITH